jgi:hypothetical protein
MKFAAAMATTAGRTIRIVVGIVLVLFGLLVIEGAAGIVVAVIGLVPIFAGAANICLLAPLLGAELRGGRQGRLPVN